LTLFLIVEVILILVFGVDEIYCLTEVGLGIPPPVEMLTDAVLIPVLEPLEGGLTP
jgi:hypothetical protein